MKSRTNDDLEVNMHEELRRALALLSGKWKLEIMVYRFADGLLDIVPG